MLFILITFDVLKFPNDYSISWVCRKFGFTDFWLRQGKRFMDQF